MRLNIRKIIFVALIFAVLGAGYVHIMVPAMLERRALRSDIRLKQRALADLAIATRTADELNHQAATIQQTIDRFISTLPSEQNSNGIVNAISASATRNKLTLQSIEPGKIRRTVDFNEQAINIQLIGDCAAYFAFLQEIEHLPQPGRITQMVIHKTQVDGEISANLILKLYFAPSAESHPIQSVSTQ